MAKSERIIVRQSFSHARVTPLVVEKVQRRAPKETAALLCPCCGAKMKLVRTVGKDGGPPTLTALCPQCRGATTVDDG